MHYTLSSPADNEGKTHQIGSRHEPEKHQIVAHWKLSCMMFGDYCSWHKIRFFSNCLFYLKLNRFIALLRDQNWKKKDLLIS